MSGLRAQVLNYTGGNLAAQLASVAMGMVLARVLTLEELGSYRQVILVTGTLAGMLSLGLPLSLFYLLPREQDRAGKGRVAGRTLLLMLGSGVAGGALLALGRGPVATALENPALGPLLLLAVPLVLSGILVRSLAPYFLSLGRDVAAGIVRGGQVGVVALCVVGVALAGLSLRAVVGTLVAVELLTVGLALLWLARILPLRADLSGGPLRAQLAYALPLGVSGVVGMLSRQVDQFMVSGALGPATFAQYSIGAVELPLVPLLVGSASSVLLPRLARHHADGDHEGFAEVFRRGQRQLALVCIPLGVAGVAVAEPFLVTLYTEDFARSAPVFQIYALVMLNRLFLYGALLQSLGLTRLVLVGELAFLVLNVGLNWWLLETMGFLGPAVATWIAGVAIMLFYQYRLSRQVQVGPAQLYDAGANLRILLLSVLGSAPAWWLAGRWGAGIVPLAVTGGLAVLLSALLLHRLAGLPEDEREMLSPAWWWARARARGRS